METQATLGKIWQGWRRVARRIGEFQTRLFLALFYFMILAPLTLLTRTGDPLGLRRRPGWRPYQGRSRDLDAARRQ